MIHLARSRLKTVFITVLLGVVLLVTGCGMSGGPIEGKVIDKSTGKPVGGVIVVVAWQGTSGSPAHSQTQCFHVESTVTDENGQYTIPRWFSTPSVMTDIKTYITLYKIGYQEAEWFSEDIKLLVPFTGTREERLAYLFSILDSTGCGSRKSYKNLFLLYNALYQEANSIATNEKQKKRALGLKSWADAVIKDNYMSGPTKIKK